jgi:hypothetical protein
VAHPPIKAVSRHAGGQVLAFFAVILPMVLMPVAAYAVDAAVVSSRDAGLQGGTVEAAEAAAQQLNISDLRARSGLTVDSVGAHKSATAALSNLEPQASVESVSIDSTEVTVVAGEVVTLPFNFLPVQVVRLRARASARLVAGYDRPSSRLPLPTNTF